jgi:hypothetical protein
MFNLVRQVLDFQGTLYILKRTIKETTIPEENVQRYKEYLDCDTVLKKDGIYYFVNKIEEAQIVEDSPLELDKPTED